MADQPVPLMEMPRDQFLAAVDEIVAQGGVDRDFLLREYNRVNSLTGEMDSDVGEGRTGVAGNFLSKPEGSTGWDAVRGLRVEPRAGAVGVAQGVEQALTAPGRALQGTMPADDMTMEAFGAASMLGGAGVARAGRGAGRVDEDTMNIFGGANARDFGFDSQGNPLPLSRGADGMERFEIDDSTFNIINEGIIPTTTKHQDGAPLGQIIEHEELFYQYPQLADIQLFKDPSLKPGTRGGIAPGTDSRDTYVVLNPNNSPEQNRSTLIHEVQHLVQEEEGFSRGSNLVQAAEGEPNARKFLAEQAQEAEDLMNSARADDFRGTVQGFQGLLDSIDTSQMGRNDLATFDILKLDLLDADLKLDTLDSNLANPYRKSRALLTSRTRLAKVLDSLAYLQTRGVVNIDPDTLGPYGPIFRESVELDSTPEPDYRTVEGMAEANARRAKRDELNENFNNIFMGDLPEYKPGKTPEQMDIMMEAYKLASGEVEARNTSARLDFTPEERAARTPESTEDRPRSAQWQNNQRTTGVNGGPAFAEGGLVAEVSNNAMADYFKAASGMMSEEEFVGKHKMSTRVFEDKFEEQNNVDISGAESFTEITKTSKGDNMRKQMSFFNEGGMAAPRVDPVSGNEIPLGSGAENVRDDIDAKLSEGEYVLPAHVVKYIGVANIEDMIASAEEGLQGMAETGRIGGQPAPQPQEPPVQMAAGGYVSDNTNFNTADYSVVGSQIGKQSGGGFDYVPYYGPNGAMMSVLMINGVPAQTIPAGWSTTPGGATPAVEATAKRNKEHTNNRQTNQAGGGAGALGEVPDFSAGDPLAEVDFSDPSAVIEWANNRVDVNNNFLGDWGDKAATILGGVVGGPMGAILGKAATQGYGQMRDVAVINAAALEMEDRGDAATAEALRSIAGSTLESSGMVGRLAGSNEDLISGRNIHSAYRESQGDRPAATASNTRGSGSGGDANPVTRATSGRSGSDTDFSSSTGRNANKSNQTASGGYGSSTNAATSTSKAKAQTAARSAGVSAKTSAGLSGETMRAGNEVGSGAGGSNRVGPMNKGGLVSRPKKY